MRVGCPDFLAVEAPARCGALGAGADACEVRSRSGLAHPDAEEDFAATDARQIVPTLFLAAEIQDQRRALPVGAPVRRDRSAHRRPFLDDDDTRDRAAPPPPLAPQPPGGTTECRGRRGS